MLNMGSLISADSIIYINIKKNWTKESKEQMPYR